MARIHLPATQPFYAAAQRFVEAALRNDDSLFAPGQPIWSAATIAKLYRDFIEHEDISDASFETKFANQLAHADADTILLAGELLYVYFLPANGINPTTKRAQIRRILNLARDPISSSIPQELDKALEQGIARAGTAYFTGKYYQLKFLLDVLTFWKTQPADVRSRALADPWEWKRLLFAQPIHFAYAERELLLHLVHPDTFEAIMARDHKAQIAASFASLLETPLADVDQRLAHIRLKLEPLYGQTFTFYDDPIRAQWQQPPRVPDPKPKPLPHTLGERLRPYIELTTHLNDDTYTAARIVDLLGQITPALVKLPRAPDADALVADLMHLRLLERLDDGRYRRWEHLRDANSAHLLRYAALTLLVPDGDDYRLPALDAPFDGLPYPAAAWPLHGALLPWYEEANLVQRGEGDTWRAHADALAPLDASTPTAAALNNYLAHLRRARSSPRDLAPLDNAPLRAISPAALEERIAEIQRELLIDRSTILRIYRSLLAGQHVILSGPPGTGKTHLARLLPSILWRDETDTIILHMPTTPELPPTTEPEEERLAREGYRVEIVTATEDWGVRHVIGGIAPLLEQTATTRTLIYRIRHGHLTRAVLTNYHGYTGDNLPDHHTRHEPTDAQQRRYRGHWLVIDEFTRAQIDVAFGSLLTTLSGHHAPTIAIPTDDGEEHHCPLPPDFRLIGTLNSYDRHFLNQMSEAMKRRFAFIDILPPTRADAPHEQALATFRALANLSERRIADITADTIAGTARMPDTLHITRAPANDPPHPLRYQLHTHDPEAHNALQSLWRMFNAIRLYRQLGTAQAVSVTTALLTGRAIGMPWNDALDSALADTLADQLQVLTRDEQHSILAAIEHAADAEKLTQTIIATLQHLPSARQTAHLAQLKTHHPAIDATNPANLTPDQVRHLFGEDPSALLPTNGLFAERLRAFLSERSI